ncbi:MAG TPA: NAD(P)H-hydrate epimerase, partial [Bacteroidales bacterium]|nr:NAD(P)H-hydrate epimerase [Bacteroidales bacterium]
MRVTDIETTRKMDRRAMTEYGIPGILLMDNAALAVQKHLDLSQNYFVIICGTGNNGGDGFALASQLTRLQKEVDVFLVSEERSPGGDAGVFFGIIEKMGVSIETISDEDHLWSFIEAMKDADVVIDALLGTGISGEVSALYRSVIDNMNDFAPKIVSVDVPSGLSAETGEPMPVAVHASKTVTFETIKKGLLSYKALPYIGSLKVEPIGIPS